MIFHYWYYIYNCKYEPEICDSCHDISMMAYKFENSAILNIKGIDWRCVV